MDDNIRSQAIALYDRFTHDGMDRRDFFAAMTRLAGGVAAANVLIGSIAASPAAASIIAADDKRLKTGIVRLLGAKGLTGYGAYFAQPLGGAAKRGTVIVIHENRGLNEHIRDVARRLALAGFRAVAPDFLSPSGGTPANEDAARAAIAKLDLGAATSAAVAMIDELRSAKGSNGKVGVVGFCWGGGFVNRLAVAAGPRLSAGVAYYGPAPDPAEARRVAAPLLLHYAGLDERVNATGAPWVAALKAAGKRVESFVYPKVNHAFNNDTSAERFDKAAADLAWQRTLAFFGRWLR
jgi:carboxymethylenebutenolidase